MDNYEMYFHFLAVLSLFRVIMYIFNVENAAKVKIDPECWKKESVREVTYGLCGAVRMLMGYRFTVAVFGIYLENNQDKKNLCALNLLFDIYFWCVFVNVNIIGRNKIALIHQSPGPAFAIQSALVLAGGAVLVWSQ
jgi:hypothetical protein